MSHVKAGGAVSQTKNMVGKRLGVKKFEGQLVTNGTILVRQRGSVFHAGKNTKFDREYSIYALVDGIVKYRRMSGDKRANYYVDVIPETKSEANPENITPKTEAMAVKKVSTKVAKTTKSTIKTSPAKKINSIAKK